MNVWHAARDIIKYEVMWCKVKDENVFVVDKIDKRNEIEMV